jgi:hypothetical protein
MAMFSTRYTQPIELALLDISRLVESRIQTIMFLKNDRKLRGHNLEELGATNFQIDRFVELLELASLSTSYNTIHLLKL